jgi:hypothetical protein
VSKKEVSSRILKGENYYSEFYRSMHMNVEFSTGRMQREKTESNWARGQTGWLRSVVGRPHFTPKNLEFLPKITI